MLHVVEKPTGNGLKSFKTCTPLQMILGSVSQCQCEFLKKLNSFSTST